MPRTYLNHKEVPKPTAVPTVQADGLDLPAWKDGRKLHTLEQASQILTEELGGNYSKSSLRRRITDGCLGRAGSVWQYDGSYKINIHNFLAWRLAHPDERMLKRKKPNQEN